MKNNRVIRGIKKASGKLESRFGSRRVFVVYLICLSITLITMLLSIIFAVAVNRISTEKMIEHIVLCFLAISLSNIPVIMRARFHFQIPAFLQILITFFIVGHFVLGDIYRFYDSVPMFDKTLHMTSGIVIAVLGFSIVYGFTQTDSGAVKLSPFFVALFSFCFALAMLVLWEIFEYGVDCLFNANMQRWRDGLNEIEAGGVIYLATGPAQGSGLIDTMIDLIIGTIGATAVSIAGAIALKKNPNNTKFYIIKTPKTAAPAEAAACSEEAAAAEDTGITENEIQQ